MGKAGAVAAMLCGMAELYGLALDVISARQVLMKIPGFLLYSSSAEAAYLSLETSFCI